MIRGLYISNTGLNVMQEKINTLSHNLANVNTTAFKEHSISFSTFHEALLTAEGRYAIGGLTHGTRPSEIKADFSMGNFIKTSRDLDFAIRGEGFFIVQTETGFKYTRDGSFKAGGDGFLVDKKGNRVLGVSGSIGLINGKPDQKFRLVNFINKEYLIKNTDGYYTASPRAGITPAENASVVQGYLEGSNVDAIRNISELINTEKSYAFNSRVLIVQDRILEKSANEIGKLK